MLWGRGGQWFALGRSEAAAQGRTQTPSPGHEVTLLKESQALLTPVTGMARAKVAKPALLEDKHPETEQNPCNCFFSGKLIASPCPVQASLGCSVGRRWQRHPGRRWSGLVCSEWGLHRSLLFIKGFFLFPL